jgi:hypothetical protein
MIRLFFFEFRLSFQLVANVVVYGLLRVSSN